MLIKQNGFQIPIPKKRVKMLVLTGNDPFLMDYFKHILKKSLSMDPEDTSIYRFDIPKPHTFDDAINAAQHRDIFSTNTLIDIYYDKNQLDKIGKTFLESCLENHNEDCVIIFQAPGLSEKKLAFLASHPDTILLSIKTPSSPIVERWVTEQLKQAKFQITSAISRLIVTYTQSNVLATAQAIEKIKLCFEPNKILNESDIKPLLIDQSIYELYELRDACLLGDLNQALNVLDYALQEKEEPVLILWTLTHEIRQLIQLHEYQASGYGFQDALNQLKIWRTQESMYRQAFLRLDYAILLTLLEQALQLDLIIKTSHVGKLRMGFEQLIAELCKKR